MPRSLLSRRLCRSNAFTLIELMIVLLIIGTLIILLARYANPQDAASSIEARANVRASLNDASAFYATTTTMTGILPAQLPDVGIERADSTPLVSPCTLERLSGIAMGLHGVLDYCASGDNFAALTRDRSGHLWGGELRDDGARAPHKIAFRPPTAGTVSISGTPAWNQILTATATGFGLGSPAGSYSFKWYACETPIASVASCALRRTSLSSSSPSDQYTLVDNDIDLFMRATATVANTCISGCGAASSAPSAATTVVAGTTASGIFVTVSGVPSPGQIFTASIDGLDIGHARPGNRTTTFEWYLCPTFTMQISKCTDRDINTLTGADAADSLTLDSGELGYWYKVAARVTTVCTLGCGGPVEATLGVSTLIVP